MLANSNATKTIYLFQTAVAQTTQASVDTFAPSVKASCVGGTMTIRVDTKEPFEGIIHGPNRTESGCSVIGRGATKTYLRIDLTKHEGQQGWCGVKYNEVTRCVSHRTSCCNLTPHHFYVPDTTICRTG